MRYWEDDREAQASPSCGGFGVPFVRLRFIFVRAAAGTLAVGSAAPVNLPYAMQGVENAVLAHGTAAPRAVDTHPAAASRDAQVADGDDLRHDAHLNIGGDLPSDSSEWGTSAPFGRHAGLMAALEMQPNGVGNGARDAALAETLDDRPATGDAESSAFGSVFGNAPQPALGGSDFFSPGNGGTGATGGTGGSGTGGGGTIGGATGSGGGPFGGGGTGTTAGPGKSGGTGGTGGGGGPGSGTGSTGGSVGGSTGGSGTGTNGVGGPAGSTGGTGGATQGGGTSGGTSNPPPIDTSLPTNPGSDDHSGAGSTGGGNPTRPDASGAVPEPASWATMLAGFGLIGGALRARRRKAGLV